MESGGAGAARRRMGMGRGWIPKEEGKKMWARVLEESEQMGVVEIGSGPHMLDRFETSGANSVLTRRAFGIDLTRHLRSPIDNKEVQNASKSDRTHLRHCDQTQL